MYVEMSRRVYYLSCCKYHDWLVFKINRSVSKSFIARYICSLYGNLFENILNFRDEKMIILETLSEDQTKAFAQVVYDFLSNRQ